jgi:hypothetical protein
VSIPTPHRTPNPVALRTDLSPGFLSCALRQLAPVDTIPGGGVDGPQQEAVDPSYRVAAAVITAGLTVVIAANRVARADLDPLAADYAAIVEDLYGALGVAMLGFVVCLVAPGIHWVRGRSAQGRDAPSTIPPLGYLVLVGVGCAIAGIEDSPGLYYAFHFGVGALCVTWVACVLFLVEDASEPESPSRHWRQDGVIATGQLGVGLALEQSWWRTLPSPRWSVISFEKEFVEGGDKEAEPAPNQQYDLEGQEPWLVRFCDPGKQGEHQGH